MELAPGARMIGMPHKTGTREYLTCETGGIELNVAGESWGLSRGRRRFPGRSTAFLP